MDPNRALEIFVSWQTVLMCMMIFGIVYVIRRVVEGSAPKVQTTRIWNDVVLAVLPIVLGFFICWLATQYPFPAGITARSARMAYGVFCGLASGWTYNRVKVFFKTPEEPTTVKNPNS